MRRTRGFTILEVVTVLAVTMMFMAMPIGYASIVRRKSDEAAMRATLAETKSALDRCFNDTGLYPKALTDLTSATAPAAGWRPALASRLIGAYTGTVVSSAYPSGSWKGPYLYSAPTESVDGQAIGYTFSTGCSSGQIVCLPSGESGIDGTHFNSW